jgi:hypothetical protein
MKSATLGLAALLCAGLSYASLADDIVAAERLAGESVGFLLKSPFANTTLSITGPNGFHATTHSRSGAVAIDLSRFGMLPDGTYHYELSASSRDAVTIVRTPLDNGRTGQPRTELPVAVSTSGTFSVKDGAIVKPKSAKQTSRTDRDAK